MDKHAWHKGKPSFLLGFCSISRAWAAVLPSRPQNCIPKHRLPDPHPQGDDEGSGHGKERDIGGKTHKLLSYLSGWRKTLHQPWPPLGKFPTLSLLQCISMSHLLFCLTEAKFEHHLCFSAFFSAGRTCNCTCFYSCEGFNEIPIKSAIKSKYASCKDRNTCAPRLNFRYPEDLYKLSLCPALCLSEIA